MHRSNRPHHTVSDESREDKVQGLIKVMSDGVAAAIQNPDAWRQALRRQASFRQYSWGNQFLIAMQCPTATQVAGYRTWQNHGRQVRKGEKGIGILAPCLVTKDLENEDGVTEKRQILVGFRIEYIFDIAQTDGPPGARGETPAPPVDKLGWRADDTFTALQRFAESEGLTVQVRPTGSSALGYYRPADRSIVIDPSQRGAWAAKVLAHEIAHSILHPHGYNAGECPKPREQAEMEAESAAFVVMAALGFDDRQLQWYSFGYVAGWNPQPKEVIEAGDRIAKAARAMIDAVLSSEKKGEAAAA